ncbi:hypothetical protein H257_16047 [Aphanomyces astaci]|uniref:Uncharacterized protein n=1 Tax=Aphanomyces astaci TaxID=112090 RepID=W4FLN6_APHAT|nr:hypothetical protein H257_16047 [Aphanomyces astaci]ETV67811.1 hypothetical protein H257_16047 [Aphanomyces astaci]|eukprot:XP_009842669.1 hypothetical protein H257_16047 [Aphanomyces astaci]
MPCGSVEDCAACLMTLFMDYAYSPAHHYNTRRSPQVAVPSKLRAEILVKETVCARDHNGKRLHPYVFEGDRWSSIRAHIVAHCSTHMSPKASYVPRFLPPL